MFRNLTSLRFLAISIALHGMLLGLASSLRMRQQNAPENIAVSLLERLEPQPEPAEQVRPEPAPALPVRKAPGKSAPRAKTKVPSAIAREAASPEVPEENKQIIAGRPAAPAAPREIVPERSIIAERPLPTLRELLPPVDWSGRSGNRGPVSLNTSDPVYVSYFTKIKQLIEANWEYPELALRYGLQGKLSLEFTIGARGQLGRARVLRSSGSKLLDEEALRAIKAAAPFPPIPSWIEANPLSILAAMEYHDNRVHYQSAR